jgi:hypothetical protein
VALARRIRVAVALDDADVARGLSALIVFGVDATGFEVNDRGEWIAGGEAQLVDDPHTRPAARLDEGTSVRIGEPIELAVRRTVCISSTVKRAPGLTPLRPQRWCSSWTA